MFDCLFEVTKEAVFIDNFFISSVSSVSILKSFNMSTDTRFIGCPCKVRGDFEPDPTDRNFNLKISVQKDEIGFVTQYGAKWTRIQIPGRPIPGSEPPVWVEGSVPTNYLLINEVSNESQFATDTDGSRTLNGAHRSLNTTFLW